MAIALIAMTASDASSPGEAPFFADQAAMETMMRDMTVKPSAMWTAIRRDDDPAPPGRDRHGAR